MLASELHLTFLITPMGEDLSPDQQVFCRVMAQLPVGHPMPSSHFGLGKSLCITQDGMPCISTENARQPLYRANSVIQK